MKAVTYTNFRQNLRSFMRETNEDVERIVVTTNDNTNIVVMSEEDYRSWNESIYLMKNPANHQMLLDGIKAFENGNVKSFSVEDFDNLEHRLDEEN